MPISRKSLARSARTKHFRETDDLRTRAWANLRICAERLCPEWPVPISPPKCPDEMPLVWGFWRFFTNKLANNSLDQEEETQLAQIVRQSLPMEPMVC